MSEFDFDKIINRRDSGSYKWDSLQSGVIPMWVADMDFEVAPCIKQALLDRVEHGVFGYTKVSEDYYNAVINWFKQNHQWIINKDHIIYTSGVVPALSAIIKAVTKPGDKIIVQTPAYNCFFSSIRNNDCILVENPLVYSSNGYTIDFESLSDIASDPNVSAMILCNPHNPVGRVWNIEELTKIAEICHKNDVFIISDEIHCELTFNEHKYTPFGTLSPKYVKNSASCISPSKAFNIAGLQIANIVATDSKIRAKIDKAININEVCDVNPFGVVATIAAYTKGKEWLESLKKYLWDNYIELINFFENRLPSYKITPLEGTYLAWINCENTDIDGNEIVKLLEQNAKVSLNPGEMYGVGGKNFMRINLACPRSVLKDALNRIEPILKSLTNYKSRCR